MPNLFPSRGFRRNRERASGLLFAFGADDLSMLPVTGQTLTLTRATGRTVVDSSGLVRLVGYGQPAFTCAYNATEAAWEPGLAVDDERINICLQSENFGTTWGPIGSPSRTAAAATCGDLALDLLGDDSAAALEGYSQTVTCTGDALKAVSLFIKKGTSTSSVIRWRDTSAGADRLLAVVTWSGTTPVVTMTTGTHCATVALGNEVHRVLFRTTSVTALNTNVLELYPATTSGLAVANTGTLYVGGVQVEDDDYPRSYIKTTTAAVTGNKDTVAATIGFAPQSFTAYARIHQPVWNNASWGPTTDTPALWLIGTGGGAGSVYVQYGGSFNLLRAGIWDGTSTLQATAILSTSGNLDVCAQFDALTTAPRCRLDVGSGFSSWSSTGVGFTSFASAPTLLMGTGSDAATGGAAGQCINSGIRRLIIASGARTLAQMRGLAV